MKSHGIGGRPAGRSPSMRRTPWQRISFSSGSLEEADRRAVQKNAAKPARRVPERAKRRKGRKTQAGKGKESVRQEVLAGARRHFFAHGFRSVTMEELARALGMSKSTPYLHFADKEALLDAVVGEKFREVDRDLAAATKNCEDDFSAALHALLFCLQQHTQELQPAFVRDMQRSAPAHFAKVVEYRRHVIDRHFTRLLAAGQKAGVVRRDISLPVAIAILIGMTDAIANPAKVMELKLTPRTAFDIVLKVFLEGIVRRKR